MDYKTKPYGYKTVNQWKKEGKEPINDSVKEKYYVTTADGSLFLKNGKPFVYEYIAPDNVKDIEQEVFLDDGEIPSFRNQLSFLSNMHLCPILISLNGKQYTFPSAENAYQACKNQSFIDQFLNISPYEAKKLGSIIPVDPDWDNKKTEYMNFIVHEKFNQNPDLMKKLIKCDFQIAERNNWGDIYWGICNGVGENKLGNLLEFIKCENLNKPFYSSQEKAVDIGNQMLQYQNDLSEKYEYKKLPSNDSYKIRKYYGKMLPDFFLYESNQNKPLFTRDGVQIAKKWKRVVIGDYGAFVEIDPSDICLNHFVVKPGEEYRINDSKYAEHVKYHWYIPNSGYESKLYYQQKEVTYADYKQGMWYVSPYETKEGQYISNHGEIEISKTIEKSISKELADVLDSPINKIDIPNKTIVFDVETTGFSYTSEILQISIMDINGNAILDTYVCPSHTKEWTQAMAVHHITPDKVKNAPTAMELAPKIRDIFESVDTVVGYNVSFDIRMVKQNFGIDVPNEKIHDLLPVFKQQFPSGGHKLNDAVQTYCPEIYEKYSSDAHSSSTDTYATLMVFLKQVEIETDKAMRASYYSDENDFLME